MDEEKVNLTEVPDELVIESNFDLDDEEEKVIKPKKTTKKKTKSKRTKKKGNNKIIIFIIFGIILLGGIGYFVITNINTKTFIVKFDSDGGTTINDIKVKDGKKLSKPNNPTKEEYDFVSWQLDGKDYDFNSKVSGNITLKAIWELKLTEDLYEITFDSMGGTEVESQSINGNGKVEKPNDPIKEHFIFDGWLYNDSPYDFDTLVKSDMTLYASYREIGHFNVGFDTDGGSNIDEIVVYEGQKLTSPSAPTKYGYKFTGWTLAGEPYTFLDEVTEDITLVATWEKLPTHIITFDTDGGSSISSQEIVDNTKLTKPSNPTKEGYTFEKWQLNGRDYDFKNKVTKDITLKAVWKEATVKMCNVKIYELPDIYVGSKEIKCGEKISESDIKAIIKSKYPNASNITWLTKEYANYNYFTSVINSDINIYFAYDA